MGCRLARTILRTIRLARSAGRPCCCLFTTDAIIADLKQKLIIFLAHFNIQVPFLFLMHQPMPDGVFCIRLNDQWRNFQDINIQVFGNENFISETMFKTQFFQLEIQFQ